MPHNWSVQNPWHFDDESLLELMECEQVIVIGTVKKLDDLRRQCKQAGAADNLCLRFACVLHDEVPRQMLLDLYSGAKLLGKTGTYICFGDPRQTTHMIDNEWWDEPHVSVTVNAENFKFSLWLQKSLWQEYVDFKKGLSPENKEKLSSLLEPRPKLTFNKRSVSALVNVFSSAFYDSMMKPATGENEKRDDSSFPCKGLQQRAIFIHVPSDNQQSVSYRNDAELQACKKLHTGVPG